MLDVPAEELYALTMEIATGGVSVGLPRKQTDGTGTRALPGQQSASRRGGRDPARLRPTRLHDVLPEQRLSGLDAKAA
ncbi:MAG: hypothetical protein EBV77_06570 [Gemmatimonadaceae bacterium]|uniref:hypothetical protein n=1 Tax=Gemmatimonas sp. TaxID=1962908 RepID=UPI001D81D10C|nr:hypothetical protein [Gemmatimonas sp.]NCW45133.1 hypothetical protein [Gemmatimonadaceae bacterium]